MPPKTYLGRPCPSNKNSLHNHRKIARKGLRKTSNTCKIAEPNKRQFTGEKLTSARGATTGAPGGFSLATEQQQQEEEAPQERQQVKQQLGWEVVHQPSWSKRCKNQDSALAGQIHLYMCLFIYRKLLPKGIIKYTLELIL